jgi:general secretion pathway protein J
MTQRSFSPKPDSGFTLVEALVSLFVFGIIAAGATIMLTQTVTTQRDVNAAQADLRALQTTRAIVSADLSQFTRRAVRLSTGGHRPPFVGGDATAAMAFVRAASARDETFGPTNRLVEVTYLIDGERLLRRTRNVADADSPEAEDRVLLDGAKELRLQFFDGARWADNWSGTRPPRAVRLTASLQRHGPIEIDALVGTEL